VKTSLEQDLVGIDVSDTGQYALVHQYTFNAALLCLQQLPKTLKVNAERVGAEMSTGNELFAIFGIPDRAKPPAAIESNTHPVAQMKDHAVVFGLGLTASKRSKVTRHTEVENKKALPGVSALRGLKRDKDVFPVSQS
jgi:hypothetical protein